MEYGTNVKGQNKFFFFNVVIHFIFSVWYFNVESYMVTFSQKSSEKGRPTGKRSLNNTSTTSSGQYDYLHSYDKLNNLSSSFVTGENMPDSASEKELVRSLIFMIFSFWACLSYVWCWLELQYFQIGREMSILSKKSLKKLLTATQEVLRCLQQL